MCDEGRDGQECLLGLVRNLDFILIANGRH